MREVAQYSLTSGKSLSCGCYHKEKLQKENLIDLRGQKFNHLTVVDYYGKDNSGIPLWYCRCDCCANTKIVARAGDLKRGKIKSCGCLKSYGEEKIALLLEKNNISYEKEKTFSSLKDKKLLRFDFYIPKFNLLIEFDGQQHFDKNNKWYSESLQLHDQMKTLWAKQNHFLLIRIPYTHINELTINDLIPLQSSFLS